MVSGHLHAPATLSSAIEYSNILNTKPGGPQSSYGRYGETNSLPLPGNEPLFIGGPARSLFTLPTELCRLLSLPVSGRQFEDKGLTLCKALYCIPFPQYTSEPDAMMHRVFLWNCRLRSGFEAATIPIQVSSVRARSEPDGTR